jgi:hypothetical protein
MMYSNEIYKTPHTADDRHFRFGRASFKRMITLREGDGIGSLPDGRVVEATLPETTKKSGENFKNGHAL